MPPPPPPFTPGTPYEFPFTPLLPSQLLLGSPFQTTGPTSAAVFSSNPQYAPSVPPQPLYDSYYHHSPGISSSSPSGAGTIHHSSSAPAGSPSSQGYPAPPIWFLPLRIPLSTTPTLQTPNTTTSTTTSLMLLLWLPERYVIYIYIFQVYNYLTVKTDLSWKCPVRHHRRRTLVPYPFRYH